MRYRWRSTRAIGNFFIGLDVKPIMNEPQEAILVRVIVANEERTLVCTDGIQKLKDDAERLREINADISAKLKKFEIPQGPAFINGRWE